MNISVSFKARESCLGHIGSSIQEQDMCRFIEGITIVTLIAVVAALETRLAGVLGQRCKQSLTKTSLRSAEKTSPVPPLAVIEKNSAGHKAYRAFAEHWARKEPLFADR
jgi:hypothetical protein